MAASAGNTAAWLPPQPDNSASMPQNALIERCELCRQPIAEGQDFVTNSSGQRPTHSRCLGVTSQDPAGPRLASRTWLGMFYEFVKS
jgi:hypothetical protein